jgi:hypothetical protein
LDEHQEKGRMDDELRFLEEDVWCAFSGLQAERLSPELVMVALSGANHEVDAVVVNFAADYVVTAQDELHLDEVFCISAELKAVQSASIVFVDGVRRHKKASSV